LMFFICKKEKIIALNHLKFLNLAH
jgi:hypothetical protein